MTKVTSPKSLTIPLDTLRSKTAGYYEAALHLHTHLDCELKDIKLKVLIAARQHLEPNQMYFANSSINLALQQVPLSQNMQINLLSTSNS